MKTSQTKLASGASEGNEEGVSNPELAQSVDESTALPLCSGRPRVSLEAEVPEALFDGMREFIRNHPQWDQYSVITSALAGFLFLHGAHNACVKDQYLAALFYDY